MGLSAELIRQVVVLVCSIVFAYIGSYLAPDYPVYDVFQTRAETQLQQYIFFHIFFHVAFFATFAALLVGRVFGMKYESIMISPLCLYFFVSGMTLIKQKFSIQFEALSVIAFPLAALCALGVFLILVRFLKMLSINEKKVS